MKVKLIKIADNNCIVCLSIVLLKNKRIYSLKNQCLTRFEERFSEIKNQNSLELATKKHKFPCLLLLKLLVPLITINICSNQRTIETFSLKNTIIMTIN